jgi:hexosaminidase
MKIEPALILVLAAVAACAPQPAHIEVPAPRALQHAIVPVPATIEFMQADSFTLATSAAIIAQGGAEAERVARYLAALIGTTVESTPRVLTARDTSQSIIELAIVAPTAALGNEGYELTVTSERVRIAAATPAGLFYGVQTLRQLLPPAIEYTATRPAPMKVAAVRIADAPRFEWRGLMLDVARHFLELNDVKRLIDDIVLYKLNRLHLHLSDDQGWRIEIPSWPKLTEHGGSIEVGGGPGGFYTQQQFADLVQYASDRFVTIVPEIDMPGHTNAALASYPELNCDSVAPALYTGIEVGFSALCVESDITYRFIDDVVGSISALIPGAYFHIGGDEVKTLTHEQYNQFVERVETIVAKHGKQLIGWSEVALANLSPSAIVQSWIPDSAHLAVARGSKVILSPASKIYLDMKYDSSTVLGLNWAGYVDLRTAYDWEPAQFNPKLAESAILGLEAALWAETIGTIQDVEFMTFPRLAAVAEIGWSPVAQRGWSGFSARARAHEERWTARGQNYRR